MGTVVKVESLEALRRFHECLTAAEAQLDPIIMRSMATIEAQNEWIGGQLQEAVGDLEAATESLFAAQASYEDAKVALDAAKDSLSDAGRALEDAASNLD